MPNQRAAKQIVYVDNKTHKALKIEAAKTGMTIGQLIASLLEKKQPKPKGATSNEPNA